MRRVLSIPQILKSSIPPPKADPENFRDIGFGARFLKSNRCMKELKTGNFAERQIIPGRLCSYLPFDVSSEFCEAKKK
ncbi:MAG: hypothetical protein D6816_12430 [Bacteroidetes bacterium]|nr:MAG: hypothetical protein D6816_12430 [Bacteroidota bacterium]